MKLLKSITVSMVLVLIITMTAQYHHHDSQGRTYSVVCEQIADWLDDLGCHCHHDGDFDCGSTHDAHSEHRGESRGDCGHCALGIDLPDTVTHDFMVAVLPNDTECGVMYHDIFHILNYAFNNQIYISVDYSSVLSRRGPPQC